MLSRLCGEFFCEILGGVEREASQRGYSLPLFSLEARSQQAQIALRAIRGRVDGLLVIAPDIAPAALERALPSSVPALLVNCRGEIEGRPALRLNNIAEAREMVRHLVGIGRQGIVHIAGPEENIDAQERAESYRAAMHQHAPGVECVVFGGHFSEKQGKPPRWKSWPEGAVRRGLRRQRYDGDRLSTGTEGGGNE